MRRSIVGVASVLLFAIALVAAPHGATPPANAAPPPPAPVIAAVGDIACKSAPGNNRRACQYDNVAAAIIAANPTKFLALGDNQYEYGLYNDFLENYDVYFHQLLPITEPVPGNHEYGALSDAAGYFSYFGEPAHGPGGYYSYDLGSWHIIALNSAICGSDGVYCAPGTDQYEWLQGDLAAHPTDCTLAYWHHPHFDWLKYQNADWTQSYEYAPSKYFWDLLYAAGADVVLNGHNHNYSRWKPMDPTGFVDATNGITQFIVGTGGRNLNDFGALSTKPSTFVTGQTDSFGFLRLTLKSNGYDYKYVTAAGSPAFTDQGKGACH
jgi:hypothetical protein